MCYLKQSRTEPLPASVIRIVEQYRLVTGLPCEAYVVDDSAAFLCADTPSDGYNPFCKECSYQDEKFYPSETLKFFSLHKRPYIFCCHGFFYHWLILKETPEANYLFVCGPLRTEKDPLEIIRKARKPSGESLFVSPEAIYELPYIHKNAMSAYSRLLFDLIEIHLSDPNDTTEDVSVIPMDALSKMQPDREQVATLTLPVTKAEEKKINDFFRDNIRKILKLAPTGDKMGALACLDNILQMVHGLQDVPSAISYVIGMLSLFGQSVSDSEQFTYTPKMFSLYTSFLQTINDQKSMDEVILCTRLYFIGFWDEMQADTEKHGRNGISTQITDYILANYPRAELSIQDISDALHVSQSYMCRTFKRATGLTVKHYILVHRVTVAAGMLFGTSHSVAQIAEQTGFATVQAFRKAFREYYHMSPTQYKRICKAT